MRRILSIMIMCLLLAGCGKADTPAQTTAPATPAETVAVTTAPATEGPEGILEEKQTETVYLLTRTTVYSGEAQEDWHRECTYDAAGRLVEEFDYVAGHTLSARCSYTYDEDDDWTWKQLTLSRPLSVSLEGGETAVLEEGTKLRITASDCRTVAHFMTQDGRKGVLPIAVNEEKGWGFVVEGIDEEDLFESVPYSD